VLTDVCESLGLDAGEMTPACRIVQHTRKALVMVFDRVADFQTDSMELSAMGAWRQSVNH
jgi:hypothetical protein